MLERWWRLPQCRLVVLVGWCPGLLAGSAGHAVGLSYMGWLACAQHGTVYVGRDPGRAVELISQWLPDVWEAWYLVRHAAGVIAGTALGCATG